MSRSCSSRLDGGGDALIAAAAANVAAHRAVDLVFRGVLVGREKCCGLHDLAGLAIAALRDIQGSPSPLHRVIAVFVSSPSIVVTERPETSLTAVMAGARGFAVHMNRAGATQRYTAAIFRPGEPQFVAQIPEQRHRWVAIEGLRLAVVL